jgi:hypothetical protein
VNFLRTRAPLAVAAASLLAISACNESSTGSSLVAEGSVTFTYTGAEAGTYNATGRFDRQNPERGTYGVGGLAILQGGEAAVVVYGQYARSDQLYDQFILSTETPEVGTYTCETGDLTCSFGGFFFVGATEEGETEGFYTSVGGTLTITSVNEDRVRGTFALQLEALDVSDDPPAVQVTGGTFDVPIVQGVD